jgi:hypothetical protein
VIDQIINGDDVRVLELARDPGFFDKPGSQMSIGGAVRPEFFQSHVSAKRGISGHPDSTEAASPVQSLDVVAAAEGRRGRIRLYRIGVD